MKIRRVAHIGAAALSFAAAVISYQLLNKHVSGSPGAAWFEAGCSDTATPGGANCAAVLASPYSYFPPKSSNEADRRPRLPVALLGLIYYSGLFVWFLCVGRPAPQRRWLHGVPLVFIGFGLAMSVYFTRVMFRVLDQWCPWCMVTHGLNLVVAVCAVAMWPGRPKRPTVPAESTVAPAAAYPPARLVFVTVLAIVAVSFAELMLLGVKTWKRQTESYSANYNNCLEAVKRFKGDAEALVKNWQAGKKRELVIRPDDPARLAGTSEPGRAPLDVVVFSDFECPSCARFAEFVESQAQPLFAGGLKMVFKHYPLDQSCNDRTTQTMHRHACHGAALVEAARSLGGNDAFWKAHDFVFKNREALAAGKLTAQAVAAAVGLDPAALADAAQSEQFRGRIAEDVEQARLAEVRGTPAVFVEGKLVDTIAVTEIGFWDKLADTYWQRTGEPRPPSTRLRPTPGSPSPKAAP